MDATALDRVEILRRAMLVPCETRDHLRLWIKTYLDIEFPDCVVDPDSNATPLDLIWEAYALVRAGGDPERKTFLFYAARDSYKSLAFAVFQLLAVLHLDSDVVHMAAIELQARKVADYIKAGLERPLLQECKVGTNLREIHAARMESPGQKTLTFTEWRALTPAARSAYRKNEHYTIIIPATVRAANGQHALILCLDEAEIIQDSQAFKEAKLIPTEYKGRCPVTLITSSRKFAHGLVQKLLDDAPKTGLQVRHWNLLDITQRCLPDRHLPDLPRLKMWRSDELLQMATPEQYDSMSPDLREKFTQHEVAAGCATCQLYPACRGNLINQRSTSNLLRSIPFVIGQFKESDLVTAQSQLLCRKPSTKGLIYPQLDPQRHRLSAAAMAEMVTGEEHADDLTYDDLIRILQNVGGQALGGMDFGAVDPWASVVGFKLGERLFVVRALEAPGLDPDQQIALADQQLRRFDARWYPDMSGTGYIQIFRKAGFRMTSWKKAAGSILDGITVVRQRIAPAIGRPLVFFLAGDLGVERLFEQLTRYHWKNDAAGEPVEIPDEKDDHLPDAFRYLVQNAFTRSARGGVVTGDQPQPVAVVPGPAPADDGMPKPQAWMQDLVQQAIRDNGGEPGDQVQRSKKGKILWSI